MANIYVAHNWDARLSPVFMTEVVEELRALGHTIVSRWLWQDDSLDPRAGAQMDVADIQICEYLVFFADQFSTKPGRGKFVELGMAYALGKKVVIVASPSSRNDCIFYNLPGITMVRDIPTLLEEMASRE